MPNLRDIAMGILSKNPNITNNPRNKEMFEAIKNNDAVKGEEIANNLLNSYGMTKEQALQAASKMFNIPI